MSCRLINRWFDSAFELFGALTRKNTGQTVGTTLVALSWQEEVYDLTGWHDNVTNNTRQTVPSGQDIEAVRIVSGVRHSSENNPNFRHMKSVGGGAVAVFYGMGNSRHITTGADTSLGYMLDNIAGAIVEVNDAESAYFVSEMSVSTGSTTPNNHGNTFMGVEVVDPDLRRVLARKTSDQAIAANVPEEVTWDTTVYNVGSWTVSAENIIVPFSGRIRMTANILGGNVAGGLFARFYVNGVSVVGATRKVSETSGAELCNIVSAIIEVDQNDELSVEVIQSVATNITAAEQTWFCVEEISNDHVCVLLKRNSGTQTINNTGDHAVIWQEAVYEDQSGLWDAGAPTVVVAPFNGYFRQTFGLIGSVTANMFGGWGDQEGAIYYGSPGHTLDAGGNHLLNAMGHWAPCVAGDEIRTMARSVNSLTIGTDDGTFMSVEFRT